MPGGPLGFPIMPPTEAPVELARDSQKLIGKPPNRVMLTLDGVSLDILCTYHWRL